MKKDQTSPMIEQFQELNFSFRSFVAREPALWLLHQPYTWWDQRKKKLNGLNPQESLIQPDTELVIDGFQGSANSFATEAFKLSQPRYVKLAHHLHSPSRIIQAIDRQIPILLTVREPIGTVLSLTSRWPYVTATQALKSYVGFYAKLQPYADRYVTSTFVQTTQHLDRVIEAINTKYGTDFAVVDFTTINAEMKLKHSGADTERKLIKQQKQQELLSQSNSKLLSQAKALYASYEERATTLIPG